MQQVNPFLFFLIHFSLATISGYDKWTKRPTLSGGPLNGDYQLAEIHWDITSVVISHAMFHYGHTVNGAKYDLEGGLPTLFYPHFSSTWSTR